MSCVRRATSFGMFSPKLYFDQLTTYFETILVLVLLRLRSMKYDISATRGVLGANMPTQTELFHNTKSIG